MATSPGTVQGGSSNRGSSDPFAERRPLLARRRNGDHRAGDPASVELARRDRTDDRAAETLRERLLPLATYGDSQLYGFLRSRIVRREPVPQEPTSKIVARTALQVFAPVVAMWGNVYYFPVNMQAAGGNAVLGYTLCTGSSVAVLSLDSWAMWSLIDEYLGQKFPEERRMMRDQFSCCAKTAIGVVSFATGLIAQSSIAYVAYISNDRQVLPPIILFCSDSPLPIFSCKMSVERLLLSRKNELEQDLNRCREGFVQRLAGNRVAFLRLDHAEQMAFVRRVSGGEARAAALEEEGIEAVRALLEQDPEEVVESGCYRFSKNAAFVLGCALATVHQSMLGAVGYRAGVEFAQDSETLDPEALGYSLAVIVALANLYLNGSSVANNATGLFQGAVDFCNGDYVPNMAEQLRPTASWIIRAIGFVASVFSFGGSIGIAQDAFDEEWLQETFGITVSVSYALFTFSAFLMLTSDALDYAIKQTGEEDESNLILFDELWRKFIQLLNSAPESEIAIFILRTPEDVLRQVYDDPTRMKTVARAYLEGVTSSEEERFGEILRAVQREEEQEELVEGREAARSPAGGAAAAAGAEVAAASQESATALPPHTEGRARRRSSEEELDRGVGAAAEADDKEE